MYLLTYSMLDQKEPTISVSVPRLEHAVHLFRILADSKGMHWIDIINKSGVTVREWNHKNGFHTRS